AAVLDPARPQLDFTGRREIAGAVDQTRRGAEVLGQRDAGGRQAGEDEAAIARHARYAGEPVLALVEAGVAPGVRRAQQLAAQIVRPAVIGTGECPRAAPLGHAHLGASVGAAIDEDRQRAVLAADHDDRLGADVTGDEIAGPRHLAVVTDEDPAP